MNPALVSGAFERLGQAAPPLPADAVGRAALLVRLFTSPVRHARPERESKLLASAERSEEIGGGHVWTWGPAEAPAALLLHGWEGRGAQLGAFVPELRARGWRVLLCDGPAHGDAPGDTTYIPMWVDFLRAVEKSLGPVERVVAHSFGCAATAVAIHRGAIRPARVALIAGPHSFAEVANGFLSMFGADREERSLALAGMARILGRDQAEYLVPEAAETGHTEALFVHAPDDEEIPFSCAERNAAGWPGARLVRVEGAGHRKILFVPEAVQAVIGWIGEAAAVPA